MSIETYMTGGVLVERWTAAGYERFDGGVAVEARPLTAAEAAVVAASDAVAEAETPVSDCRTALTDALGLAALYPAPSPEETALIDAQVFAALAQFRALSDPPADVVALAAAVVAWRSSL